MWTDLGNIHNINMINPQHWYIAEIQAETPKYIVE